MFFRLKTYLPTAALAFFIVFFTVHALTGERGILLAHQRREALLEKQQQLDTLRAERTALELKAHFLRDESLSLDLLEERAHEALGFIGPTDYVIREPAGHG